jgi:anti-sigma factor RsiW
MTCEEAEVLLHALLDDELDAGHAREIETHVAACRRCAAQLRDYRAMRGAFAAADLRFAAPADLRRRIDARLPEPAAVRVNRRSLLKGFAGGVGLSSAVAAGLVMAIMRTDQDGRINSDLVSAHLRSLQADHLTDVLSTDQHTVKPWFNGRLDVAPPVVDLTAQGFTLIGGRLDYLDGKAVAALVYRRRIHVINLFARQDLGIQATGPSMETVQGFNIRRWTSHGFGLWAVSDLNADELEDFGRKFEAAQRGGA